MAVFGNFPKGAGTAADHDKVDVFRVGERRNQGVIGKRFPGGERFDAFSGFRGKKHINMVGLPVITGFYFDILRQMLAVIEFGVESFIIVEIDGDEGV